MVFTLLLVLACGVAIPVLGLVISEILRRCGNQATVTKAAKSYVKDLDGKSMWATREALGRLWGHDSGGVRAETGRLQRNLERLLPRVKELGSVSAHTVTATAESYLPDAVDAYLKLPRETRDSVKLDGDKTARDLLFEQLYIMNRELEKIAAEASRIDATELRVHGRFLADKYGEAPERPREVVVAENPYTPEDRPAVKLERNEPLPEGRYEVRVVKVDLGETGRGLPAYFLELEVTSGDFTGRRLRKHLVASESESGRQMFRHQLSALGLDASFYARVPAPLKNQIAAALAESRAVAYVVVQEWHGQTINQVRFLERPYEAILLEEMKVGPVKEGDAPAVAPAVLVQCDRADDAFVVRDGGGRTVAEYAGTCRCGYCKRYA